MVNGVSVIIARRISGRRDLDCGVNVGRSLSMRRALRVRSNPEQCQDGCDIYLGLEDENTGQPPTSAGPEACPSCGS